MELLFVTDMMHSTALPEGVLFDIGLPEVDGPEVVGRPKKDECCLEPFIIAVLATATKRFVSEDVTPASATT